MLKYVIGAAALIAVLGIAYYLLIMAPAAPEPQPTEDPMANTPPPTSTYATSTFTVAYPPDFMADPDYAYDQFGQDKLIHGVKFTIPGTMATGTTLAADSYVAVEQLPRARTCSADIYIKQDVRSMEIMDDGKQYSLATSSTAATGNTYEEMVYAIPNSSPCTAVRYVIHSTNIENYEPGIVQEFDRAKLLEAFDAIRRSLQLQTVPTGMTP